MKPHLTDPSASARAGYDPLEGYADTLDVLLLVTVADHPEIIHAEVWGRHERDGVFSVSAAGAHTGSTEAVRSAAERLLSQPEQCEAPDFRTVHGTENSPVFGRPLTDRGGVPRSLLTLTLAHETDHPEDVLTQRHLAPGIERLVSQAERALRTTCDREAADESLRLAEVAREVVRTASVRVDLDQALNNCADPLKEGFAATAVRIRSYPTDEMGEIGSPSIGAAAELNALVHRLAHRLWNQRKAGQFAPDVHDNELLSAREHGEALKLLDHLGWGRAMLAPIGSGAECLGHLAFGRAADEPGWTRDEEATAVEIGEDLGRAVLNGRAFALERMLVDELRDLDTYKSDLIGSVSHHLRNPLATIVGHLELASGDPDLPAEAQESLDAVERGTRRLTRVVDDLLVFAQVGDPRHPLDARDVHLEQVVADVADLAAVSVRQRRQLLQVRSGERPAIALGDREELDRLLGNLVSNAVKYTPDHGRITISTGHLGDEVEIVVRDEGIGISADDQTRLFTEFFRSTNPEALAQPGTGLGLAIVARVAARHGGRVEVTSELGVGSTFRVVLPAGRALPPAGVTDRR